MAAKPAITKPAVLKATGKSATLTSALPGPLLRSKQEAPPLVHSHIARDRIGDRMATSMPRLVLLQAPAGFGKTTAMAQLRARLEREGLQTAWITVDESDNEVSRFLAYIMAAVERLGPDSAALVQRVHRNGKLSPGEVALALIDHVSALSMPFAMFIDDFETLHNKAVLELLQEIIERFPPAGHLVIGSRVQPRLGLSRLRSHGHLLEIGVADLRFSLEETSTFMGLSDRPRLPEDQLRTLHRSTEGWAAALWLASMALQHRERSEGLIDGISAASGDIADYLAEDVIDHLASEQKAFLLKTSILDHLCAGLCDAVTGQQDGEARLQEALRTHLFLTPTDDERTWFRYHGLFARFLRGQLQREYADQVPELHRRASRWYFDNGRPVPGITQALASGDMDYALPLLSSHAPRLLNEGRIRLLVRWLDQVAPEALSDYPFLRVVHIWAAIFTRGPQIAMGMLDTFEAAGPYDDDCFAHALALRPLVLSMMERFEEAYALAVDSLPRIAQCYAYPLSVLSNVVAQLSVILGHYSEARKLVAESHRTLGMQVGTFNRVFSETVEAEIDLLHGRLRQAGARLRHASSLNAANASFSTNGNVKACVSLAETRYEADDCEGAERLLNIYTPLTRDVKLPDQLIIAHIVQSRIAYLKGEPARSFELLGELEHIGDYWQLPRVADSARLERARIALMEGNVSVCGEELEAVDPQFWARAERYGSVANDVENLSLCHLRLQIHLGHYTAAITALNESLAEAQQRNRNRRVLKLRILLATAYHLDGNPRAAVKQLREALRFGHWEGFVRSFADEGIALRQLLREFMKSEPLDEFIELAGTAASRPAGAVSVEAGVALNYLDRVFSACLRTPGGRLQVPVRSKPELPVEPLSPKEIEVVKLLNDGGSNAEIAERMHVAVTTVRTHLRNISSKTGATNRTQIIAIARRNGWVE